MVDVAALAGVSVTTVSRVINDHPSVSATVAARVQAAIEQLDYRHDANASILRRLDRRTSSVGLVLADVANPFMSALFRAVEDDAWTREVLVLAGSSDESGARERQLVAELIARRVDGMIIVPTGADQSYLLAERRHGTAIVFVDRAPRFLDADTVTSEDLAGSERAVTQLVELGHRRIAFLGAPPEIPTTRLRLHGYSLALESHGLPAAPELVRTGLRTVEDAEQAALAMLREPDRPTAFFAGQNFFAVGASKALRALGLEHDVALIGVDDFPLAELLDPAVTVVAHDPVELGRQAARLLFERIAGLGTASQHVVVPAALIRRGSGEIPGPHA